MNNHLYLSVVIIPLRRAVHVSFLAVECSSRSPVTERERLSGPGPLLRSNRERQAVQPHRPQPGHPATATDRC